VVWWSEFLAADSEAWVRFPALPDFPRTSGSGTGYFALHSVSPLSLFLVISFSEENVISFIAMPKITYISYPSLRY
jgi:hypothetical protein